MTSLPLLPGYPRNPNLRKETYRRQQTLEWNKGVPRSRTFSAKCTEDFQPHEIARKELQLQFGDHRHFETTSRFLPKWAILEKKVLQFNGYFTEFEADSRDVYRIRPIIMRYYLVDDTISFVEPKQQNSGLNQGTLLKRQRVPRSCSDGKSVAMEGKCLEGQPFWHWSDLNRGIEMGVYGRKYFLCDCDNFTEEFLLSEGTDLNPPLQIPLDPYEFLRLQRQETPFRGSDLRPKTTHGSSVHCPANKTLKFDIMLEEEIDNKRKTAISAILSYRLDDGKVEIRKPISFEDIEIKRFSPVLLRWTKVPLSPDLTSIAEIGEEDASEMREYLNPRHLIPPATIQIFGKKVLVTGCDSVAAKYLKDIYGAEDLPEIAKYQPPNQTESGSSGRVKSDIITKPTVSPGLMGIVDSQILRFLGTLKSRQREDRTRTFIISYYTIDSTFEIYEKRIAGGLGGRTLSRMKIPKPRIKIGQDSSDASTKSPLEQHYSLKDISIGAEIDVWGRTFEIVGADQYVQTYAEANSNKVTPQLLESLRKHFGEKDPKTPPPED